MKLGRAPAHSQSQAPVSSRADRPHESQPGTCLAWETRIPTDPSVAGGRFKLPRLGGDVLLRPARVPVPPPGESSSGPCRESNPPLQLEGLMSCADRRTDLHREENRQWVVKELNLPPAASQLDGNGFTDRREEHHPSEPSASGTGGSRTHRIPGFEPGRYAGLRTWALAIDAEAVGLEPTSGPTPPPVFKTGPSSGRMTSVRLNRVPGAGIEPAASAFRARRHYLAATPQSTLPPRSCGKEESNLHRLIQSQGAYRLADPRESAPRESNPPGRLGSPAPLPLGQGRINDSSSCGGRNRTCVRAVNSRLPVPARDSTAISQSGWPDSNRRSPAPEAGGFPGFPTS